MKITSHNIPILLAGLPKLSHLPDPSFIISRQITQESTFQSHHKPIVLKRTPVWNNPASTVFFSTVWEHVKSLAWHSEHSFNLHSSFPPTALLLIHPFVLCVLSRFSHVRLFAMLQYKHSTCSASPLLPKTPGIFLTFFFFVLHISHKRAPFFLLSTYIFFPSFKHQCRFHFL